MPPTGSAYRVLQIHPTKRCNLRCLHCYSTSSPAERDQLDVAVLRRAIIDAAKEDYNVVGFSGGEPLLYKPLPELLEQAQACGMITTVTSNGTLVDDRRLAMLRGRVSLLAISLDGVPESHNRMRASERAFEMMAGCLEGVRRADIPFGFIFTLTQYNVHELEWIANFAVEQGARLLQIHPLEIVGRAMDTLPMAKPDAIEGAFAQLEVARLRAVFGDQLFIQLDLTHTNALRADPGQVFAGEPVLDAGIVPLARLVSPLVIEPDGTVVPIQYGFARTFALGNIRQISLGDMVECWHRERYLSFLAVCREVFQDITRPEAAAITNWYDEIGRAADRPLMS